MTATTMTTARGCDCSSPEDWQETGSTWLCTCPDTHDTKAANTGEEDPAYSNEHLRAKILEIYPEILKQGISFDLNFDTRKNAYVLDFRKGTHELTTHLEKRDADECLAGIKCVYLGVQVGQFIKNFEDEEVKF